MKRFLTFVLAFAMILCMTACSEEKSAGRDTLTYISMYPSESLVPLDIIMVEPAVMYAIYDGLVKFDANGNFAPLLAESWEDSSEKTVFHLNKNAKFHDGTNVTADDVIFSMDLYCNDGPYSYGFADQIASYEKNDDYTVTFYKVAPYSNILAFSIENIYILPKAAYEANPEGFETNPIGSGPYKFVSMDNDGTIKLKAFEDYFLGKAEVENIVVKPPVDASTGVVALETGEADLMMMVPMSELEIIKGHENLKVVVDESSWSCNTLLCMGERLANDENLRKAIFHGVSRENAVKLANEGIGAPAKDLFSKRLMGEFAGKDYGPLYDAALAADYLAKSNYDGSPVTITIFDNASLAQSVQSDLITLGIDAKIEQIDSNSWYDKLTKGELEMTIVPMGAYTGTLESLLMMASSSNMSYGCNMDHNEEYDALIEQIKTEMDDAKRAEMKGQALQLLYERADVISLFDAPFAYVINTDFDYDNDAAAGSLCPRFGEIKQAK